MAVKPILLLGNPDLYKISSEVIKEELPLVENIVKDLHDTLIDFREKYGLGRAIAAPQIGVPKRLIYMFINKPIVFINPYLINFSKENIELWDDCMSFPGLLVKVERAKECEIIYKDEKWKEQRMLLKDDLSELLQHEFDHLDGILAVQRAIDSKSLAFSSEINNT